ncbi:MAG: MBL fold metallo-hydrolase [Beijerinckiaceae bacterium]
MTTGAKQLPSVPDHGAHLVLLGTVAGPVLHPLRMMSSQAVVADGAIYLFDCGYGALTRFAAAGLRLADVRAVFITHHHSDHNADYANIIHLAWIQGMTRSMPVFGPPPMRRIHNAAIEFHHEDFDIRIRATGRTPPSECFSVSEISSAGVVFEDENVCVSAALVDHPPFAHAFGFRVDAKHRSIVMSGDTAPCEALVELATGADLLLHEAMYEPGIDAMLAARPYVPPGLRSFLVNGHTSAQDCGRIAARAGVKTLALTHLLPSDEGLVTEDIWRDEARRHFSGRIVVGQDLMVL